MVHRNSCHSPNHLCEKDTCTRGNRQNSFPRKKKKQTNSHVSRAFLLIERAESTLKSSRQHHNPTQSDDALCQSGGCCLSTENSRLTTKMKEGGSDPRGTFVRLTSFCLHHQFRSKMPAFLYDRQHNRGVGGWRRRVLLGSTSTSISEEGGAAGMRWIRRRHTHRSLR